MGDRLAALADYLATGHGGQVLITSRHPGWDSNLAADLRALGPGEETHEGEEWIQSVADRKRPAEICDRRTAGGGTG